MSPQRPQGGIAQPESADRLPLRAVPSTALLAVVGAHGGSGESTLAGLDDGWHATQHAWPTEPAAGAAPAALLTARTSHSGLLAAQRALRQWSSGSVPGIELLGIVFIADVPGRLPKPLRDLQRLVAGGAPQAWTLPWLEPLRLGSSTPVAELSKEYARLGAAINARLATQAR